METRRFLSYLALGAILVVLYNVTANIGQFWSAMTGWLSAAFQTFFIGIVFAFVLNIPSSFFERKLDGATKGHGRAVGILISLVLLVIALVIVLGFLIPSLIEAVSTLLQSVGALSQQVSGASADGDGGLATAFSTLLSWLDMSLDELQVMLLDFARTNSPRLIESTLNTIMGTINGALTFFISLIFAIYFVSAKEMISRHMRTLLAMVRRPRLANRVEHVFSLAYRTFKSFVLAQGLEAVIIGCLCFAGMFILRLPQASSIGVLVGVTALIPVYGAYAGAIIGAIVIAVSSPVQAVFFLVFLIILQQLEGNLIYPRVVGGSLGLPPVYTFTLVTVCGALFGLVGMLFAVPVGSILYTLLKERKAHMEAA